MQRRCIIVILCILLCFYDMSDGEIEDKCPHYRQLTFHIPIYALCSAFAEYIYILLHACMDGWTHAQV